MDGEGTVVRPSGEIDIATVEPFRHAVREALAQQPPNLVLDLTDVTFLDSSGLSVLAGALKRQRTRGGGLAVVHPQPIVRQAIELVGLGMLIEPTGPGLNGQSGSQHHPNG